MFPIHIGPSRKVWLSHGPVEVSSWLNGYRVRHIPSAGRYAPIFESPTGELWSRFGEGVIFYQQGEWVRRKIDGFNAETTTLLPESGGHLLIGYPDRLVDYDFSAQSSMLILSASETGIGAFSTITPALDGGIWVAGNRGLIKAESDSGCFSKGVEWEPHRFPQEFAVHDFQAIIQSHDGMVYGTAVVKDSGKRILIRFDGKRWSRVYVTNRDILQGWADVDGNFWIVKDTHPFASLHHVTKGKEPYREQRVQIPQSLRHVALEPGSPAFWVSTYRSIARYAPATWRTPPAVSDINTYVNSIYEDPNGRIWFTTVNQLIRFDGDDWRFYPFPDGITTYRHTSRGIGYLKNGLLAINTENSVFLVFDPKNETFDILRPPDGTRVEAIFPRDNHTLWVQAGDRQEYRLDIYDGDKFRTFLDRGKDWNIEQLRYIHECPDGTIWFGGMAEDRVARYQNNVYETMGEHYPGDAAMTIMPTEPGIHWFADRNNVFQYDGQEWTTVREDIDQVPSMIRTRDDYIWLASWSGLYRYDGHSWILNTRQDGLASDDLIKVLEDRQGRLWVGTYEGLSLYHPGADRDAPDTQIPKSQNLQEIAPIGEARFVFTGIDKWKYTQTDRLLYSFRIDNQPWSAFQSNPVASITSLTPGAHRFQVRAMDRNFNIDPTPSTFAFTVLLPWYQELGFLFILVLSAGTIVMLIGLLIYRHFMLHQLVNVRTRELSAANAQLRQDAQELSQAERKLRSLSSELTLSEERERHRISTIIHDRIGHTLAYMKLKLAELQKRVNPHEQKLISDLLGLANESIKETHTLTLDLSSPVLHELGFYKAVPWLVQQFQEKHALAIFCSINGDAKPLSKDIGILLFHSIRELLHNVVKHAQAAQVTVTVQDENDRIKIVVEDDGKGFNPRQIQGLPTGYGLFSIRQRLKYIGGQMTIESSQLGGTRITLVSPFYSEKQT